MTGHETGAAIGNVPIDALGWQMFSRSTEIHVADKSNPL